ncbi:Transcriptional regulator, LuxR family [Georgfuchsia toluolica]|uniref:Transcriptional regulator, LuxR family n=1 Tax=Georgfuchsia toluolica TaxID=424218 RepID=A0A916J593_9PROT|nr:LuxR C-terminal-related transcriptional regulator [Georgfuchsia toluolica]CAG4883678.1 Transcriptional regulator, LuxR family [Georgfuchsia toluolica]
MNPGATDPQLILKATPPRLSKTLLLRPRLSSSVPQLADKSLVVIQAPAGFGKTSLLSQWRREALRRGAVAAWLTLDERDDVTRLALGLALAIRMASGRASFGKSYAHVTSSSEGGLEALTSLLAEVAHMAVEVEIILDDVHTLPKPTLETCLTYLFHNAPANLKLFLGSRKQLAMPVEELLTHGQVAFLDADALRFTRAETISIVTSRFGSRADSDICVRMHDLTEGWPLGLQLVIATIEKSPSLGDAITGFSVRSGDIQRYFVECLVNRLPSSLVQFLVQVSCVDALHPELCQAITGRKDSAELLQRLQDTTPIFLSGIDSDWSRIHSLARKFLRDRFAALPSEDRRTAHERAARWLAERSMFEAAARQALQAGQDQLAYEFVAHCLYDLVTAGQVARVTEWIERLPAAEIEKHPRLRLAVAWTLAMSEQHGKAARLVEPLIDDPTTDPDERRESAEICAAAAFFADDFDGLDRNVTPWVSSFPTQPAMLRAVGINQLAMLDLYHGMPEKARYHYQQLSPVEVMRVGEYTRGWMDWVVSISYLWQGQVVLADEVLQPALARAEEQCGRRSPIAVVLASALAMVLWERDLTGDLTALLANRLDVLERHAAPDAIAMGYVCAARNASKGALERRAFDLLENLYALGEARGLSRLCVVSLAEQIRMQALRSHGDTCSALIARLNRFTTPKEYKRWGLLGPLVKLQAGIARAYEAVALQDWERVLVELKVCKPIAEQLRRIRDGVQISLLQALALKRCGEDGRAQFSEAISMANSLGLERILVDTHPDLIDWMQRVQGGNGVSGRLEAARVAAIDSAVRPLPRARVSASALLTSKESEVLQLLAGNLSNKQIALALNVGDETVKWHLKNLFSKLDAGNRKHLLDRARLLGVLDTVS